MANVQNAKCEKNVVFILEKIAKLELQIKALAEAMGLEMSTKTG